MIILRLNALAHVKAILIVEENDFKFYQKEYRVIIKMPPLIH